MESGTRVRRTIAEKRRIVELTLVPGASVARIARAEGVNANQIFQWRRAYRSGSLEAGGERSTALLPVLVPDQQDSVATAGEGAEGGSVPQASGGMVHIEFPGRALVSVESGASPAVVRAIIESLRR